MNIKSRTDNLIQRKRNLGIAEIIQLGESGGLLTQSQVAAVMQLSHSTVSRLVNFEPNSLRAYPRRPAQETASI